MRDNQVDRENSSFNINLFFGFSFIICTTACAVFGLDNYNYFPNSFFSSKCAPQNYNSIQINESNLIFFNEYLFVEKIRNNNILNFDQSQKQNFEINTQATFYSTEEDIQTNILLLFFNNSKLFYSRKKIKNNFFKFSILEKNNTESAFTKTQQDYFYNENIKCQ